MSLLNSAAELDALITDLYEGVTDDEVMVSALNRLGESSGYLGFNVVQMDTTTGALHTDLVSYTDTGHPLHRMMEDRANEINPYMRPEFARTIIGKATFANETLSRAFVEKTDFYADYMRGANVNDMAGFFSVLDGGIINTVSFPRAAEGSYTDDEKAMFRFLSPHAIRAFDLRYKLGVAHHQQQFMEQLLNKQATGIVFFNHLGEVTWLNKSALEAVSRNDGLKWTNDRLLVGSPALNDLFQRLLERQINAAGRHVSLVKDEQFFIPKDAGFTHYGLSLSPISLQQGFCMRGAPVVAAFIVDPTRDHTASIEQMMAQFGLTRAEAFVAVQIAQGLSIDEIAANNAHKVATARNLLKRAFAKTGASRQSELAQIVWSSSIPLKFTVE